VQHSPDADTIDSAIFRAESLYLNLCRVETVVLDEQEQYRSLLSKVQVNIVNVQYCCKVKNVCHLGMAGCNFSKRYSNF